jgi:hypothetical protein
VTTYVDADPQNWELPKPKARKLDPPPQNQDIKTTPDVKNTKPPKKRVQDQESDEESKEEDNGLVDKSTEEKWDSWVEQQLEAYLGHLKGGQPKKSNHEVQLRSKKVPTPKHKVKKADKKRNEEKIQPKTEVLKSEDVNPRKQEKSSSMVVRQDGKEDEPWLKTTTAPKKIGQRKKKWQQLRNQKRENSWREKAIANIGQRMVHKPKKKSAKRKWASRVDSLETRRENSVAPREESKNTVQDHDLIPAWKIKRLVSEREKNHIWFLLEKFKLEFLLLSCIQLLITYFCIKSVRFTQRDCLCLHI